jgi:hypothetical protein
MEDKTRETINYSVQMKQGNQYIYIEAYAELLYVSLGYVMILILLYI